MFLLLPTIMVSLSFAAVELLVIAVVSAARGKFVLAVMIVVPQSRIAMLVGAGPEVLAGF